MTLNFAPIVLFVYCRPSHTQRALNSLRTNPEAAESELIIFSDGPKSARDLEGVAAVRAICREVKGFAKVTVVERQENWGLARSVISGVTEVCASHGWVIVLEDDLVLSPHFLAYMNEALNRYAGEEKVYQISGYQFPIPHVGEHDAAFLPITSCWGWATWHRAWSRFDPEMAGFAGLRSNREQKRRFDLDGVFPFFRMLLDQRRGKVDSWGIRWYLSVFLQDGLTLFPASSLVVNRGRDGSGTHEGEGSPEEVMDPSFRVNDYPNRVRIDLRVHRAIIRHLSTLNPAPWARFVRLITHLDRFPTYLNRFITWVRQLYFMRGVRSQASIGPGTVFYPTARVINMIIDVEAIQVGRQSHICGELLTFASGGRVKIGDHCYIGDNTRIWSSRSVVVGSRVLISHGVMIMDNISHPTSAKARHEHFKAIFSTGHPVQIDLKERPIVIHDDAWIGCMSIILPGVTIGRGAIVGAGSVVTRDVPPWSVAVGNPASVVRQLPSEIDPEAM